MLYCTVATCNLGTERTVLPYCTAELVRERCGFCDYTRGSQPFITVRFYNQSDYQIAHLDYHISDKLFLINYHRLATLAPSQDGAQDQPSATEGAASEPEQ